MFSRVAPPYPHCCENHDIIRICDKRGYYAFLCKSCDKKTGFYFESAEAARAWNAGRIESGDSDG